MKSLKAFIFNFISRSGNHVMGYMFVSRLLTFFASWIALQLIDDKQLGVVIYAFQIILFIAPIASLGLNQSLIRYGAFLKTIDEKNSLFALTFKKGLKASFLIALCISIIGFVINFEIPITSKYLQLLSLALVTQFSFEMIQIQFRLQKKNHSFALAELTYSLLLVVLVFGLSFLYEELGYAIALILAPLIAFLFFIGKLNINWTNKIHFDFIDFQFWKYGFFASMANVTTTLLVTIDIILIGHLMGSMEMVTAFKYVSLIPYSFIFLSRVVMITDFVEFTEKLNDKKYIQGYIKNYMLIFSFISVGLLTFIYFFGTFLLALFDPSYTKYFPTLMILTIGISGILIIRGVFGNLLSSIGKAHINFIITSFAVLLNIIFNYYLIPIYGIHGAAITSAILMWLTGLLCMGAFYYHYQKKLVFFNK